VTSSSDNNGSKVPHQKAIAANYYKRLGLEPSASVREIRQAYRDLSKLYHPDTTELPAAIATETFQKLNEAYATLSSPERRLAYDNQIGYSRVVVSQPLPSLNRPQPKHSSSAYLDPTDRALSPGELFALFILGVTFLACLVLAIAIGITRGEKAFQPLSSQTTKNQDVQEAAEPQNSPFIPKKAPDVQPNHEKIEKELPSGDPNFEPSRLNNASDNAIKSLPTPAKKSPIFRKYEPSSWQYPSLQSSVTSN
jgi:curved DNA-binding protein CbpA